MTLAHPGEVSLTLTPKTDRQGKVSDEEGRGLAFPEGWAGGLLGGCGRASVCTKETQFCRVIRAAVCGQNFY